MIIWDSRLPHQNYPNTDDEAFRVVHYTMMEIKDWDAVMEHRKLLKQKMIVMNVLGIHGQRFPHALSALGREVNCLDDEGIKLDGHEEVEVTDMVKDPA